MSEPSENTGIFALAGDCESMDAYDRNMGRADSPPDYRAMSAGDFLSAVGLDAAKWADAFVQINPEADWGNMLGWFANAIETARDAGRK